jgi:hypothetical protein
MHTYRVYCIPSLLLKKEGVTYNEGILELTRWCDPKVFSLPHLLQHSLNEIGIIWVDCERFKERREHLLMEQKIYIE